MIFASRSKRQAVFIFAAKSESDLNTNAHSDEIFETSQVI